MDCPVYRGENAAWAQCAAFTETIADPQAWVEHVTTSEPFLTLRRQAGMPEEYVTVTYGAPQQTGCSLARLKEQHIDLQRGHRPTQGLLLHEVAHLCSPLDAHHDWRYAANYITLCRHWLGQRAGEILAIELRRARALP